MPIQIKSMEITINGVTYRADNVKQIDPPESKRRLILSLIRDFASDVDYGAAIHARERTLREVFAHKFPDATKFKRCIQDFAGGSDWRYILQDAQPEHMNWAAKAKECGLIDAFLVDYDPEG